MSWCSAQAEQFNSHITEIAKSMPSSLKIILHVYSWSLEQQALRLWSYLRPFLPFLPTSLKLIDKLSPASVCYAFDGSLTAILSFGHITFLIFLTISWHNTHKSTKVTWKGLSGMSLYDLYSIHLKLWEALPFIWWFEQQFNIIIL